jgi:osmotically-inducible protein OsmY
VTSSLLWRPVLVATLALLLTGCAPLLLGGAVVGGGLVATDRRTAGTQLLTGEVPNAAERARVEGAVDKVENVRGVVNELVVAGNSSLSSRSADTVLATKVKATLVDAQDLSANAFRVVAERRVVYLMGRVTPREAERGAELASRVSGVERVVKVFDLITEAQLAAETALPRGGAQAPVQASPAPQAASAPAPAR